MTEYIANMAGQTAPGKSPHSAGEVYVSDGYIDLKTALVKDDLISLCILPPKCVPLGFSIECEDLDTGTAITLTAGLKTRAGTDLIAGHNFFVDSTVAQAGGIKGKEWIAANFDNLRAAYSQTQETLVALKVTTAPAGGGIGGVRGVLTYRAQEQQDS
jgi:hypothetical protein